jgi:hypothetical protein
VAEAGDDYVVFDVKSAARGAEPGKTLRVKHQGYGTCGTLTFVKGETWLFAANDLPMGATTRLTAEDMGADGGANIDELVKRLGKRIDPPSAAVPTPEPVKDTKPIPGTFKWSSACSVEERRQGHLTAHYTLDISQPDAQGLYTVKAVNTVCDGGRTCTYEGKAPASGYGEIVLTPPRKIAGLGCSVIVSQSVKGTEVHESDHAACPVNLGCEGVSLDTPAPLRP